VSKAIAERLEQALQDHRRAEREARRAHKAARPISRRKEIPMTKMTTILLPLALALAALPAHAEQRNFAGPNGNSQGSAYDYGRSTTFTDRKGQVSGSSIQNGNTTTFYDRNGHYQGTVTRPSTSTSHPLRGR